MGIGVTEKQELIKLMEGRVDAQITAIEAANISALTAMRARAHTDVRRRAGVTKALRDLEAMRVKIAVLEAAVKKAERQVAKRLGVDEDYRARDSVERRLGEGEKARVDELLPKTPWGRQIVALRRERAAVKTALLLASTSAQVKDLWLRFNAIIGTDATPTRVEEAAVDGA